MGLLKYQIIFDKPQQTFFSGETVTGKLLVQNNTPKKLRSIFIKFKGEAHVQWTESDSEGKTTTFKGREKYFENRIKLLGNASETSILPPGEHAYPFSMVLRKNLPSSFEGKYGYIRYTAKATIDRPWKFDIEVKAAFTVISNVDLNLNPNNREPIKCTKSKSLCNWICCLDSGLLTLVTILPARGFVPGQRVPITVEVDNASNVNVNLVFIELEKYVKYRSTVPKKMRQKHVMVERSVLTGGVRGKDSKTWTHTFTIPPLPPSQLAECKIIDLEYKMKVRAKLDGMHNDLTIEFPITIGTVPLVEAQPLSRISLSSQDSRPMPNPSAPGMEAASSTATYSNIPPPSYEECMFGTTNIGDSEDNVHVSGLSSFNPRYPTYNFETPPPYPGLPPKI